MYEIKIICFNMTDYEMILLDISCTKFDVPDYRSWKIIQHRISQQFFKLRLVLVTVIKQ